MQRLFVAIDLPQAVKRELAGICLGLPGARWVADEQIHLTLRFIGEVDGGVFQDIREELAEIQGFAFAIRLVGLGFFPPRRQPHVLWAGVEPVEPLLPCATGWSRSLSAWVLSRKDGNFRRM